MKSASSQSAIDPRPARSQDSPPTMRPQHVLGTVLLLGAVSSVAMVFFHVVARVSELSHLAETMPFFPQTNVLLLYGLMPLVVLSSFALFLLPGAGLSLAWGRIRNGSEWFLFSFAGSVALCVLLSPLAILVTGIPVTRTALFSFWVLASIACWATVLIRSCRSAEIHWPLRGSVDARRLGCQMMAIYVLTVILLPKIFWEDFNLDGIEAFEFGRSLSTHVLPYWDMEGGVFGFYHNFFLFAYPNHWFITLFGQFEAAARLPFVLYVAVLFAAVVLLIEVSSRYRMSGLNELLLWMGLAVYALVQTFSTNYEPFFADLAEMAATDTLWVVCFLGTCYALFADRTGWFWLLGLMTFSSSPGALLLLGALVLAALLGYRRHPSRLYKATGLVAACVVLNLVYDSFYGQLILDGSNNQFSGINMLRRLFPPQLAEFGRLNALLFPCGILPALVMFAPSRTDVVGRSLAIVGLVYFFVIYTQAWASLHQFTPVMIIPLAVFWRWYLRQTRPVQGCLSVTLAVTTAVSFYLSLPQHFQINQETRKFGLATEYQLGDYQSDYEAMARAGESLYHLLPEDYRLQYPEQPWGTDPYCWLYYATRPKPETTRINYRVQPASLPAPGFGEPVARENGVALYVRDAEIWKDHRSVQLPRAVASPIYDPILRNTYKFFRNHSGKSTGGESLESFTSRHDVMESTRTAGDCS